MHPEMITWGLSGLQSVEWRRGRHVFRCFKAVLSCLQNLNWTCWLFLLLYNWPG